MKAQLNIELRSRILEYSLVIEGLINDLLLLNLGIYNEKEKTKLFSNKGKLTFQGKIDLLFDIDVLSKDENSEFELLMNIRNKFLHVLDCNSFKILFNENLKDNGLQNRFKKFLEKGQSISDEEACKKASYKLFQKNIDTIKKKININKDAIELKYKIFQLQNQQLLFYTDIIHDLFSRVNLATEHSESENSNVAIMSNEIHHILQDIQSKLVEDRNTDYYKELFNSEENIRAVFGIKGELKDLPKWDNLN